MTTPQDPQQTPRPRLRIVLAGDVSAALVVIGELDVEIVRDELPHSLRSLAPDDYVDQGDEPHEPDNGDHVDPWATPRTELDVLSLG